MKKNFFKLRHDMIRFCPRWLNYMICFYDVVDGKDAEYTVISVYK